MQQRQQQQQQQQCATGDIVRMDMEMMWEGLPCFDLWAGFEGLGSLGSDFLRKEQGGEEGVRSCLLVALPASGEGLACSEQAEHGQLRGG